MRSFDYTGTDAQARATANGNPLERDAHVVARAVGGSVSPAHPQALYGVVIDMVCQLDQLTTSRLRATCGESA